MKKILLEIIGEIKDEVNKLNVDNLNSIDEVKASVDRYFDTLKYILKIADKNPAVPEETISVFDADDESKPESDIDNLATIFDGKYEEKGYPFLRKLFGGFLIKGNPLDNIFVPESIIRELNIQDNDLVAYRQSKTSRYQKPTYEFKILKKNNKPVTTDRRDFARGIVESDGKNLIVMRNTDNEMLMDNDSPSVFKISYRDIEDLNIKKGDVIDVAWYANNLNKGRVIWQYPEAEITKQIPQFKIVKKNLPENKSKLDLANMHISMVGFESHWSEYMKLVSERGGTFTGINAQSHKTSISAVLRKSNIVLVGKTEQDTDVGKYIRSRAEFYQVPLAVIADSDADKFLDTIYKQLDIKRNFILA